MYSIKNFGRVSGGIEIYDIFGLNFKFTDLQAVIGQSQMTKLQSRVLYMRRLFDLYYKYINGNSKCQMIIPQTDEWIPWFIEVLYDERDKLAYFLKQHNIGTRPTYPSIHGTIPYYEEYKEEVNVFVNTDNISKNGLFLPSHVGLTDEQIRYISYIVRMYT
jgi:perosamine synthetase